MKYRNTHVQKSSFQIIIEYLALILFITFLPTFIILSFASPYAVPYYTLIAVFVIFLAVKKTAVCAVFLLPVLLLGKCDGGHVEFVNAVSEKIMCGSDRFLEVETVDLSPKRGSYTTARPEWYCVDESGERTEFNGDAGLAINMGIYLGIGIILLLIAQFIKKTMFVHHNSVHYEGRMEHDQNEIKPLDEKSQMKIFELLSKNRKIEAIKVYREATGQGLKECKEAVEKMYPKG